MGAAKVRTQKGMAGDLCDEVGQIGWIATSTGSKPLGEERNSRDDYRSRRAPPELFECVPTKWYDLGLDQGGNGFGRYEEVLDWYNASRCANGGRWYYCCDQCEEDYDYRWSASKTGYYRAADRSLIQRNHFSAPRELVEWRGPRGEDHPDCDLCCCAVKARLAFCATFHTIYSLGREWESHKRKGSDIPTCMLPYWGGYYWHYDAALGACERYIQQEWESAIQKCYQDIEGLSLTIATYRAEKRLPPVWDFYGEISFQPNYKYDLYTQNTCRLSASDIEARIAQGAENIALKRAMLAKELALLSATRERIHTLFQKLNDYSWEYFAETDGELIEPEIALEAALMAFERGDACCALNYLIQMLADPNRAISHKVLQEARLLHGRACLEANLFLEAAQTLSQVIEEDPSNQEAYLSRAQAHFELGFFDLARSDFLDSGFKLTPVRGEQRLDVAVGLVAGLVKGGGEGLIELGPCLLNTAQGLAHGLWASATDPAQVSEELVTAALDVFEFIKGHTTREILEVMAPELSSLVLNWDTLSSEERGHGMGHVIGKFGVDVLLCEGAVSAVKRIRALKHLNACATLELVGSGGKQSERVISQAGKYAEKRAELRRPGHFKIHNDKQGKHIEGRHNFDPKKSLFTHDNPQKLLDDFGGTGRRTNDITFGEPGYKEIVDFGEVIGQCYCKKADEFIDTTIGTIHYSKDGVHIVPHIIRGPQQ